MPRITRVYVSGLSSR